MIGLEISKCDRFLFSTYEYGMIRIYDLHLQKKLKRFVCKDVTNLKHVPFSNCILFFESLRYRWIVYNYIEKKIVSEFSELNYFDFYETDPLCKNIYGNLQISRQEIIISRRLFKTIKYKFIKGINTDSFKNVFFPEQLYFRSLFLIEHSNLTHVNAQSLKIKRKSKTLESYISNTKKLFFLKSKYIVLFDIYMYYGQNNTEMIIMNVDTFEILSTIWFNTHNQMIFHLKNNIVFYYLKKICFIELNAISDKKKNNKNTQTDFEESLTFEKLISSHFDLSKKNHQVAFMQNKNSKILPNVKRIKANEESLKTIKKLDSGFRYLKKSERLNYVPNDFKPSSEILKYNNVIQVKIIDRIWRKASKKIKKKKSQWMSSNIMLKCC